MPAKAKTLSPISLPCTREDDGFTINLCVVATSFRGRSSLSILAAQRIDTGADTTVPDYDNTLPSRVCFFCGVVSAFRLIPHLFTFLFPVPLFSCRPCADMFQTHIPLLLPSTQIFV